MKINAKKLRVRPEEKVKLREWPTIEMAYPKSSAKRRLELKSIGKQLAK